MSDDTRLAVIEEIVKRIEQQNQASLTGIQETLNDVKDEFQAHLVTAAVQEEKVAGLQTQVANHQETLHGERGLVKRMEQQEKFSQNIQAILWEVAKPALSMLGIMLVISLGIFAVLFYGLTTLLPKIP